MWVQISPKLKDVLFNSALFHFFSKASAQIEIFKLISITSNYLRANILTLVLFSSFSTDLLYRSSVTAFLEPGLPGDGGWSEWGEWTECDKLCGKGKRVRERTCLHPTPRNGEKDCQGAHEEIEDCKLIDCRK